MIKKFKQQLQFMKLTKFLRSKDISISKNSNNEYTLKDDTIVFGTFTKQQLMNEFYKTMTDLNMNKSLTKNISITNVYFYKHLEVFLKIFKFEILYSLSESSSIHKAYYNDEEITFTQLNDCVGICSKDSKIIVLYKYNDDNGFEPYMSEDNIIPQQVSNLTKYYINQIIIRTLINTLKENGIAIYSNTTLFKYNNKIIELQ
jgi:hypothetical protein